MRVALALGSGGARGYAHIGALQVLQERGHEVVAVAGTSMGALVGGVYAAGALEAYTDWACSLTQRDLLRLLDVSFSAPGAIRAEKILAKVADLLGDVRIEDLDTPFTAVATDLWARREVWFQSGPVAPAIRASIALPGVITPVMSNGRLLADGGLMNPVPIAPTASALADLTMGVALDGDRAGGPGRTPVRTSSEPRAVEELLDRVRRGAQQMLETEAVRALRARRTRSGGEQGEPAPEELEATAAPSGETELRPDEITEAVPADVGMFDVMNLSLEVMQSVVRRYRLASYPPEVLVTVPKDACRTLDFHRAAELIELGRTLTTEALDAYEAARVG